MPRIPFTTTIDNDILQKLNILSIMTDRGINEIIEEATEIYYGIDCSELIVIENNPAKRKRFTSTYKKKTIDRLRKCAENKEYLCKLQNKNDNEKLRINQIIEVFAITFIKKSILKEL